MKPTSARMAKRVTETDDRITCQQCRFLVAEKCRSNDRKVFGDMPRDVPMRCAGFARREQ